MIELRGGKLLSIHQSGHLALVRSNVHGFVVLDSNNHEINTKRVIPVK